mmetsp:Transcript_5552/g.14086  ORF Transcript_5552/g.14086 Transcript_5552/m.14086 type:complete len:225 (-) Transcript_5552:58-732(-)
MGRRCGSWPLPPGVRGCPRVMAAVGNTPTLGRPDARMCSTTQLRNTSMSSITSPASPQPGRGSQEEGPTAGRQSGRIVTSWKSWPPWLERITRRPWLCSTKYWWPGWRGDTQRRLADDGRAAALAGSRCTSLKALEFMLTRLYAQSLVFPTSMYAASSSSRSKHASSAAAAPRRCSMARAGRPWLSGSVYSNPDESGSHSKLPTDSMESTTALLGVRRSFTQQE